MSRQYNVPKLSFLKNGISQVAIVVPDLDRAVENYYHRFGIGPWVFYTYEKPLVSKMTYHGEAANYSVRIALSRIGHTHIELVEQLGGDSIYADHIEAHGYGPHHYGLLVDDMEAAVAEAEAAGLKVTMDGAGFGRDGDGHYAYLGTEDEFGAVFELIEFPKGRVPPEKVYPPPDDSA
jgi:catechol 2,3-dioxygenase-like lactoylglutathione lyase family enzyme